jgi:hypothetical protein
MCPEHRLFLAVMAALPTKVPYGQDGTQPSPSYPTSGYGNVYTAYGAGASPGPQQYYPGTAYTSAPGAAGHPVPPPMHISPMGMEEGGRPHGAPYHLTTV